ncbi:N-acetyltransferase [Opitutaceae bacterium EW11]|nr:N-acetyltransferase [Opitutaceae bacterium EW11]
MEIARAEAKDLDEILRIQKRAYLSEAAIYGAERIPPLSETIEAVKSDWERKTVLKATVLGRLAGSVRLELEGALCRLGRFSVRPELQGRGIGSALLTASERVFPEARQIELFTGSRSEANLRLYASHGYVRVREEPLPGGVSIVYLRKTIPGIPACPAFSSTTQPADENVDASRRLPRQGP